jgi:predicted enzyme related to lactoylglutathione lyase
MKRNIALILSVAAVAAMAALPGGALCHEERSAAPASAAEALPWSSPVLLAEDPEEAAAWYRRALDFEPSGERVDGTSRILLLSRGLTVVSLRPLAVETTGSVGKPVKVRAALTLFVEDVDSAVAKLGKEGAAVVSMPQDSADGRLRIARIVDPFGNRVVLEEPLPRGS